MYNVRRLLDGLPFLGQTHHLVFVATQRETLVKARGVLTLQLAEAPVLPPALYLIEVALLGILNAHQNEIVRPRQSECGHRHFFLGWRIQTEIPSCGIG